MNQELESILRYLRLWGLLARWDKLLEEARCGDFSHERLLKHVLQAEYRTKHDNARELRRKRAHIPELLEMETFPFNRQPKLNRKQTMSLYDSFDYMTKKLPTKRRPAKRGTSTERTTNVAILKHELR